jgi:hypothetical protein
MREEGAVADAFTGLELLTRRSSTSEDGCLMPHRIQLEAPSGVRRYDSDRIVSLSLGHSDRSHIRVRFGAQLR